MRRHDRHHARVVGNVAFDAPAEELEGEEPDSLADRTTAPRYAFPDVRKHAGNLRRTQRPKASPQGPGPTLVVGTTFRERFSTWKTSWSVRWPCTRSCRPARRGCPT